MDTDKIFIVLRVFFSSTCMAEPISSIIPYARSSSRLTSFERYYSTLTLMSSYTTYVVRSTAWVFLTRVSGYPSFYSIHLSCSLEGDAHNYLQPTHCNVVKFAVHGAGHTHTVPGSTISTPRTILSHPDIGLRVPRSALKELRVQLRSVYPALAEKPFSGTRMCW